MEPVSETNDETGGVDGVSEGEAAQRVKGFNVESSPNGANFDVVAVHGIHQSFRETWAGDEADNPTWLEAAFSSEPVRLMSYSYDSDEAAAKAYTYQGIYQHAEALLDGLAQQQTDAIAAEKRSIVLVGHDVGGVIVKAAIVLAMRAASKFSSILPMIRVLIFFGYPHRGRSRQDLEEQFARLLCLRRERYGPGHIVALAKGLAEAVDQVNNEFLYTKMLIQAHLVNIISVESDPAKRVFEKFTAVLGTTFETRIESEEPHMSLAKYGSVGQRSVKDKCSENWKSADFESPGEAEALRNLLHQASPVYPLPEARQITPDLDFEPILSTAGNCILHVRCNSETLATSRAIYSSLDSKKPSNRVIMYFQFEHSDCRFNNIAALLTTILSSLYHNVLRSLKIGIAGSLRNLDRNERGSVIDLYAFWSYFMAFETRKIIYVLGGLDQCDESVQWFLTDIGGRLSKTENHFQFVITTTAGRDEHLTSLLSNFPTGTYKQICAESNTFLSAAAPVKTALDLAMLLHEIPLYAPYEVQIRDLSSRCAGDLCLSQMVSQWLRSTKNLIDDSIGELINVAALSPEMVFEVILRSVPTEQQRWANILISWSTFSVRPLRVEELCTVSNMASGHKNRKGDFLMYAATRPGLAGIQGHLGGIFTVRRDEVHFGHPSLRGWLESRAEEPWSTREWYHGKTNRQRHLDILESSLDYLGLFKTESPADVNQSYQLPYAIQHWLYHYEQILAGEEGIPASIEQGISSVWSQQPALHRWVRVYNGLSSPFTRVDENFKTMVPVAAHFGLDSWIRSFGEDLQEISLAFVEASKCGHETLIRRLLEESPYTISLEDPSLHQAAREASFSAHHSVIREILRHVPKKLETSYHWLDVLLCRASYLGWTDVVERLLGIGVPVNPPNCPSGMSPLHLAARMEQLAVAKILLEAGANTTCTNDPYNQTPLHVAGVWGSSEVTKLLLEVGSDVEARRDSGYTPLEEACSYGGHHAVVELIAAHKPFEEYIDHTNNPESHPLLISMEGGYTKVVETLLRYGANPDTEDKCGTALVHAIIFESIDMARLLLKYHADVNKVPPRTNPAIVEAASRGNIDIIELLLEHGADIEKKELSGSGYQRTALHRAVYSGFTKTVKFLLDHHADPNAVDEDDWSAIWTGARYGNTEIVRALAEAGANINSACGWRKWTPLHAGTTHVEVVRFLVEHGADVNYWSPSGTPIELAARAGDAESLGIMLASKKFKPDLATKALKEAFTGAVKSGNLEVVSHLLEAGVGVKWKDDDGDGIIALAFKSNSADMIRTILEYSPDLTFKNSDGDTILHGIAMATPKESVRRLVNAGAKLDVLNRRRETPLSKAARYSTPEIIEFLFSKYSEAKSIESVDGTPLHCACRWGSLDNVKTLVEYGSNINSLSTGASGTPLLAVCLRADEGADEGDEKAEMLNFLLDRGATVTGYGGRLGYPIIAASLTASPDIIKLLLSNGAIAAVGDSMGRRPVHLASYNSVAALDALAVADDEFSRKDHLGRVALHYAAASGQPQLIETVWTRSQLAGISIDQPDNDNWTPLMWVARSAGIWGAPARDGKHAAVVDWLLGKGADAEACGRGLFNDWTPHEVAIYSRASSTLVENIDSRLQSPKKRFKREKKGRTESEIFCTFCLLSICGLFFKCVSCDDLWLCFKCYRSRGDLHLGHDFTDQGYDWDSDSDTTEESMSGDKPPSVDPLPNFNVKGDGDVLEVGSGDSDDFDELIIGEDNTSQLDQTERGSSVEPPGVGATNVGEGS